MPRIGHRVPASAVQKGNHIATRHFVTEDPETGDDIIHVTRSREVKSVTFCSVPEKIHLDGECYDNRFAGPILVH